VLLSDGFRTLQQPALCYLRKWALVLSDLAAQNGGQKAAGTDMGGFFG